jgi:hypothetical protein
MRHIILGMLPEIGSAPARVVFTLSQAPFNGARDPLIPIAPLSSYGLSREHDLE